MLTFTIYTLQQRGLHDGGFGTGNRARATPILVREGLHRADDPAKKYR